MLMNKEHRILIFGASGGIGSALIVEAKRRYPKSIIYACSRVALDSSDLQSFVCDPTDEQSLQWLSESLSDFKFDRIIVATGILHDGLIKPEKRYSDLSKDAMFELFSVNTVVPSLIAKYFLPLLQDNNPSVFAALSARVGSISDNRLGGWYSYRASKAALNMILKTLSIEMKRRNKQAIILGLHPGTVYTALSKPYSSNAKTVFTPEQSAIYLWDVIETRRLSDTGLCFDWKGDKIDF
jgi:NAD(P)-dependent dehydrogenase (short-subunit alcohol dehydrogenase family)